MAGINIVLDAYWVEGLRGGPKLAPKARPASLIAETTGAIGVGHRQVPHAPGVLHRRARVCRDTLRQWWNLAMPVMPAWPDHFHLGQLLFLRRA